MSFLIALLTVVLVLDCVLLILLVLIQLPKKDAGAGLAFGGGTTDALFGAGSGNALTKITKYAAGIFLGLAVVISLLQAHERKQHSTIALPQNWQSAPAPQQSAPAAPPTATPAAAVTPAAPAAPVAGTNVLMSAPVPAPASVPVKTN